MRADRHHRGDGTGGAEGVADGALGGSDAAPTLPPRPSTVRRPWSSVGSPSGVLVACAQTRSISAAPMPAFWIARRLARARARAARRRQRDVVRVGTRAVADQLGQDRHAAPLRVPELLQHQRSRRPRRSRSRRGPCRTAGWRRPGRRCESTARAWPRRRPRWSRRPPPRCRRRASPRRHRAGSSRSASPMAWPPVAQALTGAKFGPCGPKLMATWPGRHVGDGHGDEEGAQPVRSACRADRHLLDERARCRPGRSRSACRSPRPRRPPGVPAGRPRPWPRVRPPARAAWRGRCAGSPCGRARGTRRSPGPRRRSGWSAATDRTTLMVRTPDSPATRRSQNVGTSLPSGVTAPMPVTTTRRRPGTAGVPELIG